MRVPRAAVRRLLLASSLAFLALPAGAGEEYLPITPSQVKARDFRIGEKRSILAKYQELINQELKLCDIEARIILSQQALRRGLLELVPQKDNVTVFGTFQKAEEGSEPALGPEPAGEEDPLKKGLPIFQVERIEPAPRDLQIFEGRMQELLAVPGSPWQFEELAQAAAANLHRFSDPSLSPIARKAFGEFFDRAQDGLTMTDADGRLDLIKRIHSSLRDEGYVLDLLRAQARRFKGHAATQSYLVELGFYRIDGEWVSYGDFKQKLGFVFHEGSWVKPSRKEFLEKAAQLRKESPVNLILRNRTDREYLLLAQSGKVEKGMTRSELSVALGLPDRVERDAAEGGEIDQWNYGDRRVYFLNGHLAATTP